VHYPREWRVGGGVAACVFNHAPKVLAVQGELVPPQIQAGACADFE
jgi:hypothetical protein